MNKYQFNELPIRSKVEMMQDIVEIVASLHKGDRQSADRLIEDLKIRSTAFGEEIQQDVLIFAEQVYFQYDYDPWHKITNEVRRAADQLIDHLGFSI